jgi:hypothetical protein
VYSEKKKSFHNDEQNYKKEKHLLAHSTRTKSHKYLKMVNYAPPLAVADACRYNGGPQEVCHVTGTNYTYN